MKVVLFCFKFPAVLVALLGSTIPISIIGTKFAMSATPFWDPTQFSKIDVLAGSIIHILKTDMFFFFFSPCSWHALLPVRSSNISCY